MTQMLFTPAFETSMAAAGLPLTDAFRTASTDWTSKLAGHYTGAVAYFAEHLLPALVLEDIQTGPDGTPVRVRVVLDEIWSSALDSYGLDFKRRASEDTERSSSSIAAQWCTYRKRIEKAARAAGILVGADAAEADDASTDTGAAAEAAADELVAQLGIDGAIAAQNDAIRAQNIPEARRILRAIARAQRPTRRRR